MMELEMSWNPHTDKLLRETASALKFCGARGFLLCFYKTFDVEDVSRPNTLSPARTQSAAERHGIFKSLLLRFCTAGRFNRNKVFLQ